MAKYRTILCVSLAALLLAMLGADVALACPTCKDQLASDPAAANLVRGYFWSILFMLSMPFLILTGLSSYFYWEVCKARRAQQATGRRAPAEPAYYPGVKTADA
jgi:heme/copper-type cytochrome/quinol oxidase subunit 2